MNTFKGRNVELNGKSEVYFNLHKHLFSVRQNGLVVLHSEVVIIEDATFYVGEKRRQKVLKEKEKNVHAGVRGLYKGTKLTNTLEGYREAYYNPYKVSTFIDIETREPIYKSSEVILLDKRVYYK